MDDIVFLQNHVAGECETVKIIINGRDIVDLVYEVELPQANQEGHPEIAGGYAGLTVHDFLSPKERMLGESVEYYGEKETRKVAILACGGCGDVDCWPLLVRIRVVDNVVIWEDFEQPHRDNWAYDELGPFKFDKCKYEAALNGLSI